MTTLERIAPPSLVFDDPATLHAAFHAAGAGPSLLRFARLADPREDFARSVDQGLRQDPPRLDCRYLYDDEGSRLYERITALPEYYLTRSEAAILARHAADIRHLTGPATLVELGSGSSTKTRLLLEAWAQQGRPVRYVPVDISAGALEDAVRSLCPGRPWLSLVGLHAPHEQALHLLGAAAPVVVAFLGSSLGNLDEPATADLLASLHRALAPGDHVLLGVDLVKDPGLLVAAYDDAAGVTAAFTLNLFARMNRELGAGLDLPALAHEATWNPVAEQIEIHARVLRDQVLYVAPRGTRHRLRAGTRVLVEISRKFRLGTLGPRLAALGLRPVGTWTDAPGWFALLLLRRDAPEVR